MKKTRILQITCILIVLAAMFSGCVTMEGELFDKVVRADDPRPDTSQPGTGESKKPDTIPSEGEGSGSTGADQGILIRTDPDGASVYVDSEYYGKTPVLLDLKTGEFDIRIIKTGYYPEAFEVKHEFGNYRIIDIDLAEITGYLYIATDPPDASVSIGGLSVGQGVTELRVGTYTVDVRAFGYESSSNTVKVFERRTTDLFIELKPATLSLSDLSVSRKVLNPNNPGRLGEVVFGFDVTTWGTGVATIFDEKNDIVRNIQLSRFTTWNQRFAWRGDGSDGRRVPDGRYRIEISATGDDGTSDQTGPVWVDISRTAVITYRSGWSGIGGTLYAPTADLLPPSSFQLSMLAAGTVTDDSGRVPFQAFMRVPVTSSLELAIQGGAILSSADATPFSAGVSTKFDIAGASDGTSRAAIAGYAVGNVLLNTNADSQTNFSGLRGGLVATMRGGILGVSAALELAVSPFPVSYSALIQEFDPTIFSYGRLGMILDLDGLNIGLSGAVRTTPFGLNFGIQLPFALGAEVHWLIPGTNVELSAMAFSEYASPSDYYVSYGGGLGIIH